MNLRLDEERVLAPLTSLELGGPAQYFVEADTRELVFAAYTHARSHGLALRVLGGGSNLVVDDAGVRGLVLRMATLGIAESAPGLLTVQAGEPFENVVQFAVSRGLAGLECLAGIPGSTGATPVQNVGAYGQEVADTIVGVEVLDRTNGQVRWWKNGECEFAYRASRFKRDAERYVVLTVRFSLVPGGVPTLRYAELTRALATHGTPTLRDVADTVRRLRAGKSMLLDKRDPNGRSAGSFFTNPIVTRAEAASVCARAVALGVAREAREVPLFDVDAERVKLSAGWLIERAGVTRGLKRGHVGVSTAHALCLVHLGGGSSAELLALAGEISHAVQTAFSVRLEREPVMWSDGPGSCASPSDHA